MTNKATAGGQFGLNSARLVYGVMAGSSVRNYLYLPIANVTDPLQGTRMHVTVYAIPEPSCLAVIGLGLVAIGPIVRRKRN